MALTEQANVSPTQELFEDLEHTIRHLTTRMQQTKCTSYVSKECEEEGLSWDILHCNNRFNLSCRTPIATIYIRRDQTLKVRIDKRMPTQSQEEKEILQYAEKIIERCPQKKRNALRSKVEQYLRDDLCDEKRETLLISGAGITCAVITGKISHDWIDTIGGFHHPYNLADIASLAYSGLILTGASVFAGLAGAIVMREALHYVDSQKHEKYPQHPAMIFEQSKRAFNEAMNETHSAITGTVIADEEDHPKNAKQILSYAIMTSQRIVIAEATGEARDRHGD